MYTQDRADGSTADRAHIWGTYPYAEPFKVPVLSHTFHDILPYHYCCIWTDNLMETWWVVKGVTYGFDRTQNETGERQILRTQIYK